MKMVKLMCHNCGEEYESRTKGDYINICSDKCREEWRIESMGLLGIGWKG